MRDRLDWLIPVLVGSGLGLGAVFLGEALGWSDGASGTLALLGVVIGVVLRFAMHDYADEIARERAARH